MSRGHGQNLFSYFSRFSMSDTFFLSVISSWKERPSAYVEADSVARLKREVDNFLRVSLTFRDFFSSPTSQFFFVFVFVAGEGQHIQ